MNNIENRITVGIVERNQKAIHLFRQSLDAKGFDLVDFPNKKNLVAYLSTYSLDLLILPEKTDLGDVGNIPRIILGDEKEGSREKNGRAARVLNNGALDYIRLKDVDGEKFPAHDIARYTAAKINRISTKNTIWETYSLPAPTITIAGISADLELNKLMVDGKPVTLRARSFRALTYLMQNADSLVTYEGLAEYLAFGEDADPKRNMAQCVIEARAGLGAKRNHIVNVKKQGYMFVTNPEVEKPANA